MEDDDPGYTAKLREVIELKKEIERYKHVNGMLWDALDFYADPGTYFAIGFTCDPPNGEFWDDFSVVPGHPLCVNDNQKPGKLARATMNEVVEKYGDLRLYTTID